MSPRRREYRLRDILQTEEVFLLCHPSLRADFPPLNTPGHLPHNLPTHPTPFLGGSGGGGGGGRPVATARGVW